LELLEGKKLPGVEALMESSEARSEKTQTLGRERG
jgi:hypothetical protein